MKLLTLVPTLALALLIHSEAIGMKASDLKCEYRKNPLGLDMARPRLSWAGEDAARGQRQTAYRVLVASTPEILAGDKGDLWDSGKVSSDQSDHVGYAGKALESRTHCFWKVRTWDKDDKEGPWSEQAHWSMGLLKPADWQAKWIGKDENLDQTEQLLPSAKWIWYPEGDPAKEAAVESCSFRKTFEVDASRPIKSARCQVACDNQCTLMVNGSEAARGLNYTSAEEVDVASLLRPGKNVLAVKGTNVGTTPNPAGLIAALRVEYASGDPMMVVTDADWRVARGETANWEAQAFDDASWKKALVAAEYGKGPWGEPRADKNDHRLPARMLRKEFSAPKDLRRATAYVCGLGLFELYVNNDRISDHVLQPALTDYDKQAQYVTFDVTDRMRKGANAVGVWLGNGRFFAPRSTVPTNTRSFGFPKLILQLELEYADGTTDRVVSDESWKLTTEGPILANNEYDGEEYDAQREMPGWSAPGFADGKWEKAPLVSGPTGALEAQVAEPLRVTETLKPKSIAEPKPGTFIVDMGQNMVGWCRIRLNGPAGTRVRLRHAELLTTEGLLYLDNIRSAKVTDIYTLKGGGEETWEPRFTYHGFRYVEVTGWPGKPETAAFEGRVVHDDMRRGGSFSCSNDLLNRIYRNIIWGTRSNYRSMPTDCPQRDERQGWLGDRSEQTRGESYVYHVAALYSKWIRDIRDSQKPEGSVPDVAPNFWPIYSDGIVWPSCFVILPHIMYTQYGDEEILRENYDAMKLWMTYMRKFLKNGTMPNNTYGDWCVPPEDPKLIHSADPKRQTNPELLSTCYYYHDATLMAGIARLLGKTEDAAEFDKLAASLKDAFNKRFLQPDGATYDNGSQTAAVLPLAFGLVPEANRKAVFDHLVSKIEKETNGHIGTGLVGGQWLMRVLSDNGRADLAYHIATRKEYPGWGYMISKDATTIWELWNGDTADPAMNSGNHVMLIGDLNIWFTEYLAGIRPASPGFKTFTVKPYPVGDLNWVEGEVDTAYGTISSAWKRGQVGVLKLDVTVPVNTTATVHIPATNAESVSEGGKPAVGAQGVKSVGMQNGSAVFEVGSGTYAFEVK